MGVAFVAHCLLNQNSKVRDGAHCAGVYSPIIDVLRERGWRIEQMPCPELAFAGLNRFWAVREQYDTAAFRRHCQRLATASAGAASPSGWAGRRMRSRGTTKPSSGPAWSRSWSTAMRDERSFRVALVADCYVNPEPGQLDGLAMLAAAGWGVMQLPDDRYPA